MQVLPKGLDLPISGKGRPGEGKQPAQGSRWSYQQVSCLPAELLSLLAPTPHRGIDF